MKQMQLPIRLLTLTLLLGMTALMIGQPTTVGAQTGTGTPYGKSASAPNDSVYVNNNGFVGIGTDSPNARLQVNGFSREAPGLLLTTIDTHSENIAIRIQGPIGTERAIGFYTDDTLNWWLGRDNVGGLTDGIGFWSPGAKFALVMKDNGNVGIGMTSPQARLDLANGPTWRSGWKRTIRMGAANLIEFVSKDTSFGVGGDNSGNLVFFAADGNSNGPTTGSMALNKNGNLTVSGTTTTSVLQITGGADLAEPFAVNARAAVEPGTVVILDAENPGEMRVANGAYDPLVAGIISGAGDIQPGLIMQQEEATTVNGEMHPVALTGKVYVKAVGPIQVGDLLTTADVAGHAMAATDREKAFGATLGKAMSPLDEGETGLVLVLVALQ